MIAYRLNIEVGNLLDDKYEVLQVIGSGSYGDVYLVKSKKYGTQAMKVLRLWEVAGDIRDNLEARFKREYEAARISCDNLIHTLDFGTLEGNPYFVMEYCQGGDLSTLKGKPKEHLPMIAKDVLKGLHALHSEGKIHRDLKPENVLLRDNGNAALTDFGAVSDAGDKSLSQKDWIKQRPKQMFGSPLYMAPEMWERKGGGITYLPTIDIWSFGVMLYELVSDGAFPFLDIDDNSDGSVLPKYHQNAKQGIWNKQRIRNCLRGYQWLPIIEGCLTPDYQSRFRSATEVLKELESRFDVGSSPTLQVGRSNHISRLVVTQGENLGAIYNLTRYLEGSVRMVKVGRSNDNSITLPESQDTYLSRHHFTLERSSSGAYWLIRDGQWDKGLRQWQPSTNGTYLNATSVSTQGLKVFTGDIITAGEYKLKVD